MTLVLIAALVYAVLSYLPLIAAATLRGDVIALCALALSAGAAYAGQIAESFGLHRAAAMQWVFAIALWLLALLRFVFTLSG